jgi:hypothetical protein
MQRSKPCTLIVRTSACLICASEMTSASRTHSARPPKKGALIIKGPPCFSNRWSTLKNVATSSGAMPTIGHPSSTACKHGTDTHNQNRATTRLELHALGNGWCSPPQCNGYRCLDAPLNSELSQRAFACIGVCCSWTREAKPLTELKEGLA